MRYFKSFLGICLIISTLIATIPSYAEEYPFDASLYDAQNLELHLTGWGEIMLTGNGKGDDLRAKVSYVPSGAHEIMAIPDPVSLNPLTFEWKSVSAGKYTFRYDATVSTQAEKPRITSIVPYPFSTPSEITPYLLPREITDTSPEIASLASELAGGETDATKVVYNIASWTQRNIKYDLSSITADASQTSTWTYRNRYGVCDELTSLFISLSREAGIPARFVSGIAYTNLPNFPTNWESHGWAEVWLPNYGWLPVDVTYGEILWLDATHIPITKSFDAKNTAVDYSLRARDLTLEPQGIKTEVEVLRKSGSSDEPLEVSLNPQYIITGSESGNSIVATVTNDAPYLVITEVFLSTTSEVKVVGNRAQHIYLPPKATRTVKWSVTMPSYTSGYDYTVPFSVTTQRGPNAETSVKGNVRERTYPLPPPNSPTNTGLPVTCENPGVLYVGEQASVKCQSIGARVCADECKQDQSTLTFKAVSEGAFPVQVNVSIGNQQGQALVTFVVIGIPKPLINATVTELLSIDDEATLSFSVQSATLTQVKVNVKGSYLSHEWVLDELDNKDFMLQFPAALLKAGDNNLLITVQGLDKNGNTVKGTEEVSVFLPASFLERIKLFFIHVFA